MTQDQSNICHFSGQIQLISGGPSAAYLADRPRLHSGHIIGVTEAYRCIWRTVRDPWAAVRAAIFCRSEPLVKNFMNGGQSASYTQTVRATKFHIAQNFSNFHNFNFELGLLLK